MSEHSILFADLCGFTEYTCRYGDEPAAQLAVAFHNRARALAADEGCVFIKSIGDAVMIEGADCRATVRLAYRILESGYRLQIPRMFAALLLISLSGIAIFFLTSWIAHLALRHWHESAIRREN